MNHTTRKFPEIAPPLLEVRIGSEHEGERGGAAAPSSSRPAVVSGPSSRWARIAVLNSSLGYPHSRRNSLRIRTLMLTSSTDRPRGGGDRAAALAPRRVQRESHSLSSLGLSVVGAEADGSRVVEMQRAVAEQGFVNTPLLQSSRHFDPPIVSRLAGLHLRSPRRIITRRRVSKYRKTIDRWTRVPLEIFGPRRCVNP